MICPMATARPKGEGRIKLIPIAYLLYAIFAEAVIFWIIFDLNRPDKDNRDNLKKFAAENDVSVQAATDGIIRSFSKHMKMVSRIK